MPRDPKATGFIRDLDNILDDFCNRVRYIHEPYNDGRAHMFVYQHRLNTRQRNSVLKLKVATNTPDWDVRMRILGACHEELIADVEFGGGLPHWLMLENVGVAAGMSRAKIRAAKPLPTTQLAWNAWMGVMANCHWLEGLLANVVSERTNLRGYGKGVFRNHGWLGLERVRWKKLYPFMTDAELKFFKIHNEADEIHSDIGWKQLGKSARALKMEDRLLELADQNLRIWEVYLNGIGDAGDVLNKQLKKLGKKKSPAKKAKKAKKTSRR
ncbi:MAG: pyrroloquinoline quinone (PQQ) biosynthesis protein C [Alphaproteobacteria bacterium]|jgi:pyrroloquinoline quinone (PQQ) biosynthesis protein C